MNGRGFWIILILAGAIAFWVSNGTIDLNQIGNNEDSVQFSVSEPMKEFAQPEIIVVTATFEASTPTETPAPLSAPTTANPELVESLFNQAFLNQNQLKCLTERQKRYATQGAGASLAPLSPDCAAVYERFPYDPNEDNYGVDMISGYIFTNE